MKTVAENKTAKAAKTVKVKTTTKKVEVVKTPSEYTIKVVNTWKGHKSELRSNLKQCMKYIEALVEMTPFERKLYKEARKNDELYMWLSKTVQQGQYKGKKTGYSPWYLHQLAFTKKDEISEMFHI
jgi:hypothetical protein